MTQQNRKINPWALLAFIASILSFTFVTKLIAVIVLIIITITFIAVAIAQIARREGGGLWFIIIAFVVSLAAIGFAIYLLQTPQTAISIIK